MAATQEALYGRLDMALSWSEQELPERERTKHVHRLHPYLGKFVPQLVEALLDRYVAPGGNVLDPFAGSGTTLVQSLESGRDAVGVDVAGFNCLLMRVKTRRHNLDAIRRDLLWAHEEISAFEPDGRYPAEASPFVRAWYAPRAAAELLHFRALAECVASVDVLRVVLARAARSARRTTHFDLDFPRAPQLEPYWCHKHRRECRPVEEARRFLLRYTLDTLERIESFAGVRGPEVERVRAPRRRPRARAGRAVRRGDHVAPVPGADRLPRAAPLRVRAPRPGGASRRGARAPGPRRRPRRDRRIRRRCGGRPRRTRAAGLPPGAPVCVVVNDRRGLYSEILRRARLRLDERLERHVNRRTGRRAGEYYESILICRAA